MLKFASNPAHFLFHSIHHLLFWLFVVFEIHQKGSQHQELSIVFNLCDWTRNFSSSTSQRWVIKFLKMKKKKNPQNPFHLFFLMNERIWHCTYYGILKVMAVLTNVPLNALFIILTTVRWWKYAEKKKRRKSQADLWCIWHLESWKL